MLMDYEKKYKNLVKAIEEFRNLNSHDEGIRNWVNDNVPELVEIEDERIRKTLLELFSNVDKKDFRGVPTEKIVDWLERQGKETRLKQYIEDDVRRRSTIQVLEYARNLDSYNQYGKKDIDKNIAWLEKQGEAKSIWHSEDEEPKRGSLILLIMQSGTPIVAKIIEPNHIFNHGERWAYIDDLLEKQGEQKPTNKIEPKFHEGDWVVFNNNHESIYKIKKIENSQYTLKHILGGSMPLSFSNEHLLRLWTIKDAKEGDVLVDKYGNIGIFQYKTDLDWSSYCSLGCNGGFQDFLVIHENDKTHPATKEQHDTLFTKIREEGYEWDAEKKEPKKVEYKFNAGDYIIHQGTGNIYKVISRVDNQYQLKYGEIYTIQKCDDVDKHARLLDPSKDVR